MKKLTFLLIMIFAIIIVEAQTLPGINYQALLRNSNGQTITNQPIDLVATILHGLDSVEVYKETHNVTTNSFGQINLTIGEGEVIFGSFNSINWGNGPYFLKTGVDLNQSGSFQELEVVKFYSVPYAMVSGGIPAMTYEERDAIENPYEGMMILNLNTGKLNYFYNNRWYEPDGTINSFYSCGDLLIDYRDGQKYQTVQIGAQCWMAENLNVGIRIDGIENQSNNGVIEKYCYDNTDANCDIYGGLYQWDEMMGYTTTACVQGNCPQGWHLPTDAEWCILEQTVDPTITCSSQYWRGIDGGGKLKEAGTTHWSSPNTGATNSSRFTALPGGSRFDNGSFNFITNDGFWSSSTEHSASSAWTRNLHYHNASVNRVNLNKSDGFSVRCLRDF